MSPNIDLKKIIARSFPNDSAERQMFEKIFAALSKHQENFFDELEKRIDAEFNPTDFNKIFDVGIKFVKRGDTESARGLYPLEFGTSFIFDDDNQTPLDDSLRVKSPKTPNTSFFIDAAYNEIENFCAPKIYHGIFIAQDGSEKNFTYTLERHERFVRYEKILFEVAELYKIHRPVIFSPYARKAVDVRVRGVIASDFENMKLFDLLLEKNNLSGKLKTGGLFWNVKIERDEMRRGGEVEEYIGADGNLIRHEYFHTFNADEKIFILPEQHCDDLRVTFENGEKNFKLGYSSVLKERAYSKITLVDFDADSDAIFMNDFPRPNDKLRLKTEGDVEKVLASFNATRAGQKFPAKFAGLNVKNLKPLEIYRREDKYFISPETRLLGRIRNKPICYVNFGGDSIFKIDYANFVIHYLEQNYPEFNWAGVEA